MQLSVTCPKPTRFCGNTKSNGYIQSTNLSYWKAGECIPCSRTQSELNVF